MGYIFEKLKICAKRLTTRFYAHFKSLATLTCGMLQAIMYNYVNQNVKFMKKLNILSMLQQC